MLVYWRVLDVLWGTMSGFVDDHVIQVQLNQVFKVSQAGWKWLTPIQLMLGLRRALPKFNIAPEKLPSQ